MYKCFQDIKKILSLQNPRALAIEVALSWEWYFRETGQTFSVNLCSKIFPFAILCANPGDLSFLTSLILSFSLSFLGLPLVFTHCRYRGLLLHLITLSDTREHSSGREVGRRRDLCLTTHNIHKRQTSTPSAEFGKAILTSERPQACTLDCVITGIGGDLFSRTQNVFLPIAADGSLNIYTYVKLIIPRTEGTYVNA
jgi:hypothetical protein